MPDAVIDAMQHSGHKTVTIAKVELLKSNWNHNFLSTTSYISAL